jgi:protein TonB
MSHALSWNLKIKKKSKNKIFAKTSADPRVSIDGLHNVKTMSASIVLAWAGLFVGAVLVHGAVLLILWFMFGWLAPVHEAAMNERIQVQMLEPPQPPELKSIPEVEENKPEEPVDEPLPEPPKALPEPPKPVEVKQPKPNPFPKPKQEPPTKEVRRVIGLDAQSTVEGGDGPSFAVGNTQNGETERVAVDPNKVDKLGPSSTPKEGPPQETGPNQVSARAPTGKYVGAKRVGGGLKPPYPRSLERRQIEGDVKVTVTLGAQGQVISVKILKSSGYPEMDEAALTTAQKETWTPATRDGQAVGETVSYTYRFRISDF